MKYMAIIDSEELDGLGGFSENSPRMFVHKGQRMKEIEFIPITLQTYIEYVRMKEAENDV